MKNLQRHYLLFSVCLAFATGCGSSERLSPEIVETVANQAAQIATLELHLRDSEKSLSTVGEELQEYKAKLSAAEKAQQLLRESNQKSDEIRQQAANENSALKAELRAVIKKLSVAEDSLVLVANERERRKQRKPVVGKWVAYQTSFEFREDGTGVFLGEPKRSRHDDDIGERSVDISLNYDFRYTATAEPGVYNLHGTWKSGERMSGTAPGTRAEGVFRVSDDGDSASYEGWNTKESPGAVKRER